MAHVSTMDSAYAAEGFRVGRVLGRSFGVLGRHVIQFGFMMALAFVPFAPLAGIAFKPGLGGKADPSQMTSLALMAIGAVVLYVILHMIAQAVILYGTFQDMRGKPVRFGEAIVKGLARFLPILGVAICTMVAVMAGLVFFVIPGIMMTMAFYVAVAACVVEKLGPIRSMRRSAELTKGHRWKLFGLALVLGGLSVVGSAVLAIVLAAFGNDLVLVIGRFLWEVAIGAWGAVVAAIVYHDLRMAKEGIDIDRMAAVFD